jgi:hypothetical protein
MHTTLLTGSERTVGPGEIAAEGPAWEHAAKPSASTCAKNADFIIGFIWHAAMRHIPTEHHTFIDGPWSVSVADRRSYVSHESYDGFHGLLTQGVDPQRAKAPLYPGFE